MTSPRVSLGMMLTSALACATTPRAPSQAPAPAPAPVAAVAPAPEPPDAPSPADPSPAPAPTPAPAPAITITGYTPEIAALLAEPYVGWRSGTTRIALARRGSIRLRPEGPELGLRDAQPFADPQRRRVLEDGERPRIVTEDGDVRLLLYVDRQDAQPIVTRAAPLRPTATTVLDGPKRRGHVRLEAGAWVDVAERRDALSRVSFSAIDTVVSGWIANEALGTTATIVAPPEAAERQAYVTKRASLLLTRPGGKRLVALEEGATVVELDPLPESGHRWVELRPPCEDSLFYVGFVRERDVHSPNFGSLIGCGSGSGSPPRLFGEAEDAPRLVLDAGRFLLDADAPTVVGCVLRPTEVAELGDGRYAIATPWGPVPVRLAPARFEGRCGAA